jgi:hypothetical protein
VLVYSPRNGCSWMTLPLASVTTMRSLVEMLLHPANSRATITASRGLIVCELLPFDVASAGAREMEKVSRHGFYITGLGLPGPVLVTKAECQGGNPCRVTAGSDA